MIQHLGVILDGNRRFAKRLMAQPWKGHEWGAQKVRSLMTWSQELGIKELTIYAFSIQNFNRPRDEFNYIMGIAKNEFAELNKPENLRELATNGVRITFIGRTQLLPRDVQEEMARLTDNTKHHDKLSVHFAIAYGGREEILDAVSALAKKIKEGSIQDVSQELFEKHLYLQSEPDLIIRTGGEKRTSNFLVWQSWYSEWLFLDKLWPEFEKEDLVHALRDFAQRERRFGK